ncbi:MAG: Mov34/MPN/PAD-1 family protein [Ramlibacter sp.]
MIFNFRRTSATLTIIGTSDRISQRVVIDPSVIKHVAGYRQIKIWATEAGGQLFGSIDPQEIVVTLATGPYRGDERSRHRYRSKPEAAQDAIQKSAKQGLLYLGEWHTHAEDRPNASSLDSEAMKLLVGNSRLNSDSLLLFIVGRNTQVDGFGLWTVAHGHSFGWQLKNEAIKPE